MKFLKFTPALAACILLIVASAWCPFSSCKSKEDPPDNGIIMYCRDLKKSDVQLWANNKWTAKGNANYITHLWFKVNKIDDRIQIDVTPMKSYSTPIAGGRTALSKESGCEQSLSDKAEYSDNWIRMDSLRIIANDAGELIDFSFIRLTPIQTYAPYVNYKIEVISDKGGKETVLYSMVSYPCPPHCPKDGEEEGDGGTGTGGDGDGGNGDGGNNRGLNNKTGK